MIHQTILCSAFATFIATCGSSALAAVCPTNGSGEIDVLSVPQDANQIDYNCDFTANALGIKLHGVFLCEDEPKPNSYSTLCEEVYFNEAGNFVEVSFNESAGLGLSELSIPEGEYTYASFIMDVGLGIKFSSNYSQLIQGANGVGKTCWSNGNEVKTSYGSDATEFSADCGLEQNAQPTFSYYYFKSFGTYSNNTAVFSNSAQGIPYGVPRSAYLMSSFTSPATVQADPSSPNDQNLVASDAKYMLGVSKFSAPVKITNATKNVDIGFNIKNTFFQKITANGKYKIGSTEVCGGTTGRFTAGAPDFANPNGVLTALSSHPQTGAYACLATTRPTTFRFKFEVE